MAATKLRNTVLFNNANLKALYEFESGALTTDSSGQGKTLTNNNTATETTGKYGGGVAFNGTDQSLTIAEDFNIGATNWSISVWAKPSSSSQIGGVVAIGNGGSNGFSIYQGNGSGSAGNKIDGHLHGVVWLPSGVDWTGTDFNHVVMTRDTTTTRIYVNGVHRNSTTATPGAPNDVFEIGKMASAEWAGSIDEVAIFSSALSADQIKELYEGRFIGESYPQAGLVGGWHLNGGSTDFSGNNNHGTDTAITYSQANGKFGQGAGFNGSTSYIQPSTSPDFSGNFTIACWIKPTSLGDNAIFGRWTAGCYFLWRIDVGSNTMGLYSYNTWNTNGKHYIGANAVQANKWNFVVGVYDNTADTLTIHLAYDNVYKIETATKTVAGAGAEADSTVKYIGTRGGGSDFFAGAIDELLVWTRCLTAQEIRRMYAVGVGKLY